MARAHAAALVAVFQMIGDRIGRGVLDATPAAAVADELAPEVDVVLDDLDRHFRRWVAHPHDPQGQPDIHDDNGLPTLDAAGPTREKTP